MEKLLAGKRKLIVIGGLVTLIVGTATAMVFAGHMDADQWMDVAKWIGGSGMGAFAVGNGLEHLGKRPAK